MNPDKYLSLRDSIATVTASMVRQVIWSVCVLRWRRAIRKPCCSSSSLHFMSLSAIVIRLAGSHLGEVNVSSLMCILFSDSSCCFYLFLIVQRPAVDGVLCDGHLSLSGLQMRAHAMFSAEGLPPGSDTLEYAWLIDVQAGALTGKVTVPQVC